MDAAITVGGLFKATLYLACIAGFLFSLLMLFGAGMSSNPSESSRVGRKAVIGLALSLIIFLLLIFGVIDLTNS